VTSSRRRQGARVSNQGSRKGSEKENSWETKVAGRIGEGEQLGVEIRKSSGGEWRMKNTTRVPSGGRRRVILFCYHDIRYPFLLTLSYKY
jgi:hypothetical protein